MNPPDFPITALLPDLLASLQRHPRLVLEAPPGAGKTTQVPLAMLGADWLQGRRIVMLEPRRVAARAAAGFMAAQCGDAIGDTVGYRIRFENRTGPGTRVEVITEGILARMVQDDPTLEGVGAVIFDEFHERHLAADLGLALVLDVQAQLREDLRVVVMSATLDGEKLAAFLDAPRLASQGRSHPVDIAHFATRRDEAASAQLRRCVEQALASHPGDVLVFLPGQREIAQARRMLEAAVAGATAADEVVVLALHGELPLQQQSEALAPDPRGRRRIVLATNVAESSVTLPGVRVVIDSGLAREPRYDPNSGFSRLQVVSISQASADQRAGRAGRVAPGWCYRLWPQSQRLEPARRAEIHQVELAGLALELCAWGQSDLRFVDPPPPGPMAAAIDLLQVLGAIDGGRPTPTGRAMLALGTHPRLAAMLLAASDPVQQAIACDLAALVEARDPLRGSRSDDWSSRWQALAGLRRNRVPGEAHRGSLAAIDQAAGAWRRRLRIRVQAPDTLPAHALGDLLAHAFPDRIARQHPDDPRRYQMANGRSLRVFDDSALFGEPWLVASELRLEGRDSLLLRGAPVDEAYLQRLFPTRFQETERVVWDQPRRRIAAVRERRFDRIVLETRPLATPDRSRFAEALVDAVRQLGLESLPWTEALAQWRERVRCLREWQPEAGWPDLDDDVLMEGLEQWLQPALAGLTRLDALTEGDFAHALKSRLAWDRQREVDALAPARVAVPSGQQRSIQYRHGAEPVLAVKLQELFGLAATPCIVDGAVPLTLHLLSPAGRPLQVTRDLAGFWDRTYPEVRREMKGRYPRHPWPEDPWSSPATHRAKPRAR